MLAWERTTLTHRLGAVVASSAVSLAVVVAVAAVEAEAEAEAEGDEVGVLADDELDGDGDGDGDAEDVVGVGEAVPVDEVLGLDVLDGEAVGEVLVVGEAVTVSHCCPEVVAAEASARPGEAAAAANTTADAPVTRTPLAIRLVATGRTRVKHMEDVLPVLFVTYTERLITWSCYIYCQSTPYPTPPLWG
jgi:hypothetical protein